MMTKRERCKKERERSQRVRGRKGETGGEGGRNIDERLSTTVCHFAYFIQRGLWLCAVFVRSQTRWFSSYTNMVSRFIPKVLAARVVLIWNTDRE